MDFSKKCEKCNGTKRIMQKDGTVRPCWDCLMRGDMDQHSDKINDSGLKI